jgi:hypothetical protein
MYCISSSVSSLGVWGLILWSREFNKEFFSLAYFFLEFALSSPILVVVPSIA